MTTSLASQLQALKAKTSAAAAPSQKKLASFIHEEKVAAKIDLRTTYEHAKQALEQLCAMDGSLDAYQSSLLHANKAQATFNRALLTKEENQQLDEEIGAFLDALSPYFLLPSTHQVIEYMIRRYEIHVWNVEQILSMCICYHESPVFARLLTVCDLSKTPNWAFLEPVKVNNVPLLRANLSKRCFSDPTIVQFIYDAARRIGARNPKVMALYTLIVMEILDKSKITDQVLRWVLPNVLEGLRNQSYPEHQLASYMVATKLASKSTLASAARNQIVNSIAKSAPKHAQFDALLCVITIVQQQPFETLPSDTIKHILKFDDVPQLLRDSMDSYDAAKFVRLFLAGLVAIANDSTDAEAALLASLTELSTDATPFIADLVQNVLAQAFQLRSKDFSALKRVLLFISKRYSEKLDAGLNALLENTSNEAKRSFYVEFVAQTFDGSTAAIHVPLEASGLSLLLSLDHPNADIRVHALKALENIAEFDEPDVILRRLNDDSPQVIEQVVQVGKHLLACAAPVAILDSVAHALNQRYTDSKFSKAVEALLNFLTGPFLAKHGHAFDAQLLDLLLVFAPSKWLESTAVSTLEFTRWVQYLKKLKHPFTDCLKSPKDLGAIVAAWSSNLSSELVEVVAGWATPSAFRSVSVPLLAMQVLFLGRKDQAAALEAFVSIVKKEWTSVSSSAKANQVHRDSLNEVIDKVCTVLTHEFAKQPAHYDALLSLFMHSSARYFELVQIPLSEKLAKNGWSVLLQSLCRLTHHQESLNVAIVRSLTLISVMIEYHQGAIKLADLHQVFLTVLVSLNSSDASVRKTAIQSLKPLAKVAVEKHDHAALATYHNAMSAFSQSKSELLMDGNYITTLCHIIVDEKKLDATWLKHIVSTALVKDDANAHALHRRALQVLKCLVLVENTGLWESTLGWFTQHVSKSQVAEDEIAVLKHLLTHYVSNWNKPPKSVYEAVLLVLTTPKRVALQKHVAGTLPSAWYAGLSSANQLSLITAFVELMHSGEEISEISGMFPRVNVSAELVAKLLHHNKTANWIAQVTCVLEVLPTLLPTYSGSDLDTLLTPMQHILSHFKQDKASEYSVQMILTVLHIACKQLASEKSKKPAKANHAKTLVELTLEVVEATTSPQTRNAALLFVSSLVDLYPAEVLHSLVPILTHASNLHMDEYSFHVLSEIVHHSVPYVNTKSSAVTPQQFLETFVNGFNAIPAIRRLELFRVVVATLAKENQDALGLALVLLIAALPQDATFCHELCDLFSPEAQIHGLVYLIQAAGLLQDNDDEPAIELITTKLSKQASDIVERLVAFVPQHLERKSLHYQILDEQYDASTLQDAYLLLAQELLLYLRRSSTQDDDALSTSAMDGMNNLQQLLTTPGFVAVIGELLQHEDGVIRRRALALFNERIEQTEDSLTAEEELLFVDMLSDLSDVLTSDGAVVSDLQMALLSVDVLVRFFAKKHSKTFLNALPTILKCTTHANGHVVGSAFVCLSNLALALGVGIYPFVPKFFPTLLDALESSLKVEDETRTLQQCCTVALRNFTSTFPQFLVPYLPRMLRVLFAPAVNHPQVVVAVQGTLAALAQGMELRNLLPALVEMYPVCCGHGDDALLQLFELVGTIVTALDRSAVKVHLTGLMRFFLMAMDVKRTHPHVAEAVEDKLLEAIMALVLKLSEKQLKPLFLKLVSWVDMALPGDKEPHIARQAIFFRLVIQLSEQLRSIFVPYYAHILPTCASICEWGSELGPQEQEDGFFARPTKKHKVSAPAVAKHVVLEYVVRALCGCFIHDTDGFIDKEKFDLVMPPLVELLELSESYPTVVRHAVDALAHLAWAAKNDLLWKPMHHRILMKSRSEDASVRLAVLQTIEQCYTVVGEEFLAMLPESIPFLAELLEDTDSQVEALCHKVIKQIEDISGESLDQYLTA